MAVGLGLRWPSDYRPRNLMVVGLERAIISARDMTAIGNRDVPILSVGESIIIVSSPPLLDQPSRHVITII